MNKQRKTSHILNVFQYDDATGIIGLNGAPVSGYGLYLTTNINDGSVGIDSSASINALYLLKNTTKQFEISYDTSGATKIFRLLPYQSGSFFQIGNPSNAANSNSDYVFISEATYGNVLIGPGIGNGTGNLTGATASIHKVQFNGAVFANNSIQATSFKITGGASTGFLKADGTVDAVTYLSGNQSITVSGDATGSGTTSIALTLANTAVTPGVYGSTTLVPVVTVDSKGRITSVTTAAISGSLTFTGDVTGSGTTGTSTAMTLAASGVTAGTYTKVTVDSKGRVTVGASATTSDISEGTNLYYTDARVLSYLSANTYATQSYVNTQVSNLVAAAPATLDTLNELAAALGNDPSFATTISTALGNRLRVDINNQGLSGTLQGYGRTNLGLGTAATSNTGDFVAYRTFGTAANSAIGDFVAYRTFGTAANNNTGDFAAASHTHSIADVTGLQTALDGKQASGSYAASSHSHIISDVTGLQTALDGKQASLGFTPYNATNPSGYITSSGSISGSAGSVAWTNVTGRPTALSSFTNDLGNYGGWITSSGSITGDAGTVGGISASRIVYGDNSTATTYISNATLDGALKSGFYTVGSGGIPNATSVNFVLHTAYYGVGNLAGFDLACNDSTTSQFYLRPATGGGKGAWQTIVTNSGTWGINVSGTAGSISGFNNPTTSPTANTIMYRDGSGYVQAVYYYSSNAGRETTGINSLTGKTSAGAGYMYEFTAAAVQTFLGLGSLAYSSATIPTNNNQLTNGAGYIISYSETDTLASVTGRGANTSTALTLSGKVTFNSSVANRPQMPGGILGLDTSDGNFDIWGISRDYYPSHGTAANAWGIRWNGDNNDFEFVGGGTNRVVLDMDGGNITATGTLSASNYSGSHSGSSSGTNTGDQTNISGNAATATYATNSSKLYSTDAAYSYTSAAPYYGYLTYDGTYWLYQVSPASPSAVRVARADTATNFNNGYAYSSGSTVYVDTLESISSGDWLELVYYGGVGVRIGTGVNGSKALYAGSLYDAGNRVYSAGNPQVNISGNSATTSQRNFDGSLTSPDFYASGWFRTSGSTAGLYNSTHNTHFYASSTGQWNFATSNGSWIQIALRPASHESTVRGYIYADTSNNVGLLTNDGNWGLRVDVSKNVQIYGSVSATNLSGTNTGDQTNISGNAATATTAYNLQAADATQIRFNTVTNTDYSTMTFMSRAWSAVQGANGLAYNFTTHTNAGGGGFGALQIFYGESGYVLAPTSFRAPIFYDSNDTSYYLDPNNTSFSANLSGTLRLQAGAFGTNSVSSSSQATLSRTFAPQGASNGFNGGGITAAIKIRLPFRGNDCMWSMKVRIYNYTNDAVSEYTMGNYSYSAGAYHRAAYFMGGVSAPPQTVRFGNDGTYDCVWIGETTTSWSYPQVSVMDFQGGYVRSSVQETANNWNVTFVTSFDTVADTITPAIRFSNVTAVQFNGSGAGLTGTAGSLSIGGNAETATFSATATAAAGIYYAGVQKLYGGSDGTRNNGWAYHQDAGTGLHWPSNGWHIYPINASDMYIRSGATDCSLKFTRNGTTGGYVHCSAANDIGFLTTGRSWSLRVDDSGNVFPASSVRSPIYYDSNDTAKYLQRNTGTYTSWFMGGSNNGYSGWNVDGSMHLMMHTSGVAAPCGFYHQNQGWSALFYVNGASTLYHAANEKIATTSYGVYVTGEIRASSDITAYYSDIRLKKDIDVIPNAIEKIKKLRGVTYTWNEEEVNIVKNRSGQRDIGLIAQEVEEVEPLFTKEYQTPLDEAPKNAEDAVDFKPRMSETYKTIKYDKLVALLVEGMKEQQLQIEELKNKLDNVLSSR